MAEHTAINPWTCIVLIVCDELWRKFDGDDVSDDDVESCISNVSDLDMNSMSMVFDEDTTSVNIAEPSLKASKSALGLLPFLTFNHCLSFNKSK